MEDPKTNISTTLVYNFHFEVPMIKVRLPLQYKNLNHHYFEFETLKDISNLFSVLEEKLGPENIKTLNSCIVLVNGTNILHKKVKKTTLSDGDTVNFISFAGGG